MRASTLRTRLRGLRAKPKPALLVAVPVAFNLWVLRTEAFVVENLNDGSVHAAMIRAAARKFASGRIPLDTWFPLLTTGTPNFHQYQSLPHIVMGLFAALIGGDHAYNWSLYLLLSLWPISVYLGTRFLGWNVRASVAAAFACSLVASAPGYGYEWGSYTFAGLGVWAQLWAMWLLPITLGLTWRAIDRRKSMVAAAVLLSLTVVAHFITGYFAALAVGVWCIARWARKGELRARFTRGAAVGAAAAAAAAWLTLPILSDRDWTPPSAFLEGFWRDSYGAPKVFKWLLSGQLLDRGYTGSLRVPVLTILMLVGVVVCAGRVKRDVRARALLGAWALSLVLYSGRPTFGWLLDRLPGAGTLLFHRYILAVHMCSIILAGVGGAWLVALLLAMARRFPTMQYRVAAPAVVVVVALVALMPAWLERARYEAFASGLIRQQQTAQLLDGYARAGLIDEAKVLGGGRLYAGMPNNWGHSYTVGFVPGYTSILNHDAEGIGFTFRVQSVLEDIEPYLDERSLAQLNLFGIRYLLLPAGRPPPVSAARLLDTRGSHTLWEVPGSGYVAVVDTVRPVVVARGEQLGAVGAAFLASDELVRGLYPTVAYLGQRGAPPTANLNSPPKGPAGIVAATAYDPSKGVFNAQVTARRRAAVVVHASYHGRWRVLVDGRPAEKYMVMPGFPAVTVEPGVHDVEFRYAPIGYYPALIVLGLLALLLLYLMFGTRRLEARSGRPAPRVEEPLEPATVSKRVSPAGEAPESGSTQPG